MNKQLFFFIVILFSFQLGNAQDADEILKQRGEVYFSFEFFTGTENIEQLNKIGRIISIDKVEPGKIYAYANAKGFEKFRKTGLRYTVLTPPSMLLSRAEVDGRGSRTNWDFYPTYGEYIDIMNQFATDYPSLCEVVNIGQSVEGRDLLFIHINDSLGVDQAEPEFMYTSSMHGDELTGYILMLHLTEYLLENYEVDDRITRLVNSIDIWINPLANPDGTYALGNNSVYGATRNNANNINLNRNYPDPDDGPHPDGEAYQAETQAFMNFAESRDLTMSANFHGGAEVVNYPWDTWSKLAADNDWWIHVSRQYADTVHSHSPSGYMTDLNNGITNGYAWYTITGGRQDYMNYEQHCREVTIELSETKLPQPATLPDFWAYNYTSLLNYMEQSLYGVRGIITDAQTGEPVSAEVFIEGHDEDNSQVYSSLIKGDYHRHLQAGNYSITYISEGYLPIIINDLVVSNDSTTIVDVQLDSLVGIEEEENSPNEVRIYPNPVKDVLNIHLPTDAKEIILRSMNGKTMLSKLNTKENIQLQMGQLPPAMYLIQIRFDHSSVYKKVIHY